MIKGEKRCGCLDYKCIKENLLSIDSEKSCNCELGCSNTVYEAEKVNENRYESKTFTFCINNIYNLIYYLVIYNNYLFVYL